MPPLHTLEDFYQHKLHWLPDNLRQDLGHFNIFQLDDFVGPGAGRLPYSRKDSYKITLVAGRSHTTLLTRPWRCAGTRCF